mgnify:CR=1 FL=1
MPGGARAALRGLLVAFRPVRGSASVGEVVTGLIHLTVELVGVLTRNVIRAGERADRDHVDFQSIAFF